MTVLLQFVIFLLFLMSAAYFASAETALTSVSFSTWDRLRTERPRISSAYTLWSEEPSLVMASLLFVNTSCSLGASVVASAMMRHVATAYHLSMGVFLLLSSFLAGTTILIFGEILPKLFARHYQDRVLASTAIPLERTTRVLRPLLTGIAHLADVFKKLVSHRASEPLITAEELRHTLANSQTEGLEPSARRILSNIMAFDQVKVRDVMIPRSQVVGVKLERDTERMFERIVRSGFSRIPVYFGNVDNILGIVYAKDLLMEWRSSGLLVLEDLLRPSYRIAPEAPLSDLLQAFRQGHHLAVVADSFGRTQGIVTIEDAVEAIVGDISDEFDQPDTSP